MKTSFDQDFRMDLKESEEGKWFELTKGVKLKIRSGLSEKSEQVRRRLESPYRGKIPESVKKDILLRHMAEGIICDWEGVEIDGEVQSHYDPKKMEAILREMPALITAVAEIATDTSAYQDTEDMEKN